MGFNRTLPGLALVLVLVGVASGCGTIIGLSDYSVEGSAGSTAAGGTANAGSGNAAGIGGSENAKGGTGTSGGMGANGGTGASGGTGANGGTGGGAAGQLGMAGEAGAAPVACPGGCDDMNDCTDDSCVMDTCQHVPVAAGATCAATQICDAAGLCVRCLDTASGKNKDTGCPAGAPVCVGTGAAATCSGCSANADCNDGNDCTTETCTAGSCKSATVAKGTACSTGFCNGTAGSEQCVLCADTQAGATADSGCAGATPVCVPGASGPKCVACADDATGAATDSGCTGAKPICDATGTPICYACSQNSDCATDSVACTDEICTNHACTHVPNNANCAASGNVCKPNRCSATLNCQVVDITTTKQLMTKASGLGNGSFEFGSQPASGWNEDNMNFWIVNNCANPGCQPESNTGAVLASDGFSLAWLGGPVTSGIKDLSHPLALPAGTTTLQIQADSNFETSKNTASNMDIFKVRLMDQNYVQIGSTLLTKTAADAQTGNTNKWTLNGINITVDVSAFAGQDVYISFWSNGDSTFPTDFFIDNVRITATVCQ